MRLLEKNNLSHVNTSCSRLHFQLLSLHQYCENNPIDLDIAK